MTTPLVFRFPMPPNLTNRNSGRSHWRVIANEKAAYLHSLDMLLIARRVPEAPPAPFERARISSRMTLGGAMDDDNAMARHKWAVDWLRTRKYIVSDRRSCLTWNGFPDQTVTRKVEAQIEITLTPIEETATGGPTTESQPRRRQTRRHRDRSTPAQPHTHTDRSAVRVVEGRRRKDR